MTCLNKCLKNWYLHQLKVHFTHCPPGLIDQGYIGSGVRIRFTLISISTIACIFNNILCCFCFSILIIRNGSNAAFWPPLILKLIKTLASFPKTQYYTELTLSYSLNHCITAHSTHVPASLVMMMCIHVLSVYGSVSRKSVYVCVCVCAHVCVCVCVCGQRGLKAVMYE